MNYGKQNEFDFVLILNGKKIKNLDPNTYDLIHAIYNNIDDESTIKSWKNHFKQKTDVMISINGIIKGISIKSGSRNSVHVEPISSFCHFLETNGMPFNIINYYLYYHFGDGTIDGKGNKRISCDEYKKTHQKEIDLLNKTINKEKVIEKAIERFVIMGTNSKYSIDAICYGEANNYLWITKKDIIKILKYKMNEYSTGVHFSSLFCQPQTRNIICNPLYEKKRFCVQIKWYSLFDDIILNMYLKTILIAANMGPFY